MSELGEAFAQALSRKDFDAAAALLHPEIEFGALTPRRTWQAADPQQVADEVLRVWFGDDAVRLERLVSTRADTVGDRELVAYRFEGTNADGPFVLEQQAYYEVRDGRIGWMRVLCSGFRPRA